MLLPSLETLTAPPPVTEVRDTLLAHLQALHDFYGEQQGVRIARKHLSWYCKGRAGAATFWARASRIDEADDQRRAAWEYFDGLGEHRREAA